MCYMDAVGVRELRQNLSVYLDRIKEGERLVVTEHGREVALLTPLPKKEMDVLERLVAEGKATAPIKSLRNLPLPTPGLPGMPPAEVIISEMREERLP
jgi:prevent-host-death family protein